MIILTSPSKTQDFDKKDFSFNPTAPEFLSNSANLANKLKNKNKNEIKEIMNLSDNLAEEVTKKYSNWSKNHTQKNSKPALLAFKGDVYKNIEVNSYKKSEWEYAQKSLRIISGLYGVLYPKDLIQGYRLEMKTKFDDVNLYEYWKETLTTHLNDEIKKDKHKFVLNLASNEYAKAIDLKNLSTPVVDVSFKENKNGKLRTIAIYAKYARGVMINYCIKNQVNSVEGIKEFNEDSYTLKKEKDNNLLFVR